MPPSALFQPFSPSVPLEWPHDQMPPLTRSASAALRRECIGVTVHNTVDELLSLREANIHSLQNDVWLSRGNTDAYTTQGRNVVVASKPQVDHVIEIQLAEHAMMRAIGNCGGILSQGGVSMATAQAAQTLREVLNATQNLNVTTARVNQAKRGPFTAAMNRLRNEQLRTITLEQLARKGRAAWLVDDGTWARIEREVIRSYDESSITLESAMVAHNLRGAPELAEATIEEMGALLQRLDVN